MSAMNTDQNLENIKSATSSHSDVLSGKQIFLKASLLSLAFLFVFFLLTAIGVGIFAFNRVNAFAKQINMTLPEIYNTVQTGINRQPIQTNGYKNFLILGLDSVSNKQNAPELTDTIILASVNLNTGSVNTISLPRDLWSTAYQTRVNALYEYGKERYPENPKQFPEEVIQELTNIEIHHTISLSLNQLAQLVDMVNGIEIDVPQSFTDTEFPREDVDIETASPDELYETVTFEKGVQTMDGNAVIKYIRSRKSADITQGTDIARSSRQQQVLSALIEKIKSKEVLTNPEILANLFNFYQAEFADQFDLVELIATSYAIYPNVEKIQLNTHSISIYPDSEQGVITNPPLYKYNGQWVYEILDPKAFQSEVQSKLEITNSEK